MPTGILKLIALRNCCKVWQDSLFLWMGKLRSNLTVFGRGIEGLGNILPGVYDTVHRSRGKLSRLWGIFGTCIAGILPIKRQFGMPRHRLEMTIAGKQRHVVLDGYGGDGDIHGRQGDPLGAQFSVE